jgi:hypothetical protein
MASVISAINVLLGVWLVIAPWALGYGAQTNAVWNQTVVGVAISVLAMVRVAGVPNTRALSAAVMALGAWLVIAPFVFSYDQVADPEVIYWNDIVVGALLVVLAAASAAASRYGR